MVIFRVITIGETINICSNFEISIADTLNIIKELMNIDVKFITDEQRVRPKKSEVLRLWCDNTKPANKIQIRNIQCLKEQSFSQVAKELD